MSRNGVSMIFNQLIGDQMTKEVQLLPISHNQSHAENKAIEEDLVVGTTHQVVPSVANLKDIQEKEEENDFYAKLQRIKMDLNQTKADIGIIISEYGKARWRAHTSFTHPLKRLPQRMADLVVNFQSDTILCTQAYCKLMEIIMRYPELLAHAGEETPFRSLHICEAPGAFVIALKHCLDDGKLLANWDWLMNSLNPFYEWTDPKGMVCDDSLMFDNMERIIFGDDNSGNILHWDDEYIAKLGTRKFQLVTADGSFDCSTNPMEQESLVLPLITKEVQIALGTLAEGGHFVLKMYTFFEVETIHILASLMAHFREVQCKKPASSKPGNSEMYLICLNFLGPNVPVKLDNSHRKVIEDSAIFFASQQKAFIDFNLRSFNRISASDRAAMEIHKCIAVEQLAVSFLVRIRSRTILPQQKDSAPFTTELTPWRALWKLPIEGLYRHIWEEGHFTIEIDLSSFGIDFLDLYPSAIVFGTFRRETLGSMNFYQDLHIMNSLFAHQSLLSVYSHRIQDICAFDICAYEPSSTFSPTTVQLHYSNGIVLTKRDTLSPTEWVELLNESLVDGVSLEFHKNTFILSRFSASILYTFCLMFQNALFSATKIQFSTAKKYDASRLTGYLEQLKLEIKANSDRKLLQFHPIRCFAHPDFFSSIVFFNERQFNTLTNL